MVIDLVSFGAGMLVTLLIAGAALGTLVWTVRFMSKRAFIMLETETAVDEAQPVTPHVVPRSYPFSRN
ncbi:MAG: hypothetical protein AB7R40_22300 [Nitrospiraceae bacterium]